MRHIISNHPLEPTRFRQRNHHLYPDFDWMALSTNLFAEENLAYTCSPSMRVIPTPWNLWMCTFWGFGLLLYLSLELSVQSFNHSFISSYLYFYANPGNFLLCNHECSISYLAVWAHLWLCHILSFIRRIDRLPRYFVQIYLKFHQFYEIWLGFVVKDSQISPLS